MSRIKKLPTREELEKLPTRKCGRYLKMIDANLGIFVWPDGRKTYASIFKVGGTRRTRMFAELEKFYVHEALEKSSEIASLCIGLYSSILAEYRDEQLSEQIFAAKLKEMTYKQNEGKALTFYDLGVKWLEHKKNTVRTTSYVAYKSAFYNSLKHLHIKRLQNLTIEDVIETFEPLKKAPSRNKIAYCVMSSIFSYDMKDELPLSLKAKVQDKKFYQYLKSNIQPQTTKTLESLKEIKNFFKAFQKMEMPQDISRMIEMLFYTCLRIKNVSKLTWANVDIKYGVLRFDAEEMKNNRAFILPLSLEAQSILIEQYKDAKLRLDRRKKGVKSFDRVFPVRPEEVRKYFKRINNLGLTPHSVRSMFSTAANTSRKEHGEDFEIIERYLSHYLSDGVRSIYNHSTYIKNLKVLADWWTNFLHN